jgi:hypothetical protein
MGRIMQVMAFFFLFCGNYLLYLAKKCIILLIDTLLKHMQKINGGTYDGKQQ